MASGGYRKPTNPAPVSGPGQYSRRTDGKQPVMDLTGGAYGDAQDFRNIEQAAPMAQSAPTPSGGGAPAPAPPPSAVIPFGAGTQNPNEPVTSGAASGPGPGMASLGLSSPVTGNWQTARDVVTSLASNPAASPATRALAARIQGAY